jgi:hypothetical protein
VSIGTASLPLGKAMDLIEDSNVISVSYLLVQRVNVFGFQVPMYSVAIIGVLFLLIFGLPGLILGGERPVLGPFSRV